MNDNSIIDSLVLQATALHCTDEPLEFVPSSISIAFATKSKVISKLFLSRLWELWSVCEGEVDLLIFTFTNEANRKLVHEKGLWFVDESLLVLQPWQPNFPLMQMSFNSANFWIRVSSVSLCFFLEDNKHLIGNKAGKVLQVMVPKPKSPLWRRSFRILIEVNLLCPLLVGFFMKNENGFPQWI